MSMSFLNLLICVKLVQIVEFSCLAAENMNYYVAVVKQHPRIVVSALNSVRLNASLSYTELNLARKRLYLRA